MTLIIFLFSRIMHCADCVSKQIIRVCGFTKTGSIIFLLLCCDTYKVKQNICPIIEMVAHVIFARPTKFNIYPLLTLIAIDVT